MRIHELLKSMHETGVKRLLINDTKQIDYLIGELFHVSERFIGLLVQDGKATLFLNQLFPTTVKNMDVVRFHDIDDPLKHVIAHLSGNELWVDRNLASGFLIKLLKHNPALVIDDGSYAIDRIRAKKTIAEQDKMRVASEINDSVMAEVRDYLKIGVTESAVAAFITQRFAALADGVSFSAIVAFGDHTADPHAESGNRRLEEGMPIIIDMGCVKDGYCSDMTRSFAFKKAWDPIIYEIVRQANEAAIAVVKPGVRLSDIDTAARSIIEEAGYGKQFIHRLGHGIGRDVHEPFDVSAMSEIIAFEGMCFSIEPGIYIEGQGGVRIEDLVLVTKSGCEVLNHYPKDNAVIK